MSTFFRRGDAAAVAERVSSIRIAMLQAVKRCSAARWSDGLGGLMLVAESFMHSLKL
jgi:hypothetical protein